MENKEFKIRQNYETLKTVKKELSELNSHIEFYIDLLDDVVNTTEYDFHLSSTLSYIKDKFERFKNYADDTLDDGIKVHEIAINEIDMNKEIASIDNKIARTFLNTDETLSCPDDFRAISWLKTDLAAIMVQSNDPILECWDNLITYIKDNSRLGNEIINKLDSNEIIKEVEIRKDWESTLNNTKHVSDISYAIGYGFSNTDLSNLAKVYKNAKKRLRTKIEDLLTDCNFHSECGDFASGNFDKYIKGEKIC